MPGASGASDTASLVGCSEALSSIGRLKITTCPSFSPCNAWFIRIRFDASGSRDTNGSVAGYRWEFGDGTTGTCRVVTHTFARGETYTVKLTVTDDSGGTGTVTRTVTVR
jgi:chitodextrinase